MLLARREEQLRQLAEEVRGEYEVCDVGDRGWVEHAASTIRERHPAIKLLVNNAGIGGRKDFLAAEPELIEEVTRVNYLGGIWCLKAFLPALEAGAPSHLVNVVSVAGTVAAGTSGPYSASKHAQLAFSRSVTPQLRSRGIETHTILPGFAETEGFPQRTVLPRYLHRTIIDPGDVAKAILRAVDLGIGELFVPGWYRLAAVAQTLLPSLVGRVGSRMRKPA